MKYPNSQLVELIVPATATGKNNQIYFQNQPQLQSISSNKKVYVLGIETYSSLHMSGSPLTSGNTVASPADIINATLTINVAGTLKFQNIPLADLVRIWAEGLTPDGSATNVHTDEVYEFVDLWQVDWTKSYVTLINAPGDAPFSYLFNVYYRIMDAD